MLSTFPHPRLDGSGVHNRRRKGRHHAVPHTEEQAVPYPQLDIEPPSLHLITASKAAYAADSNNNRKVVVHNPSLNEAWVPTSVVPTVKLELQKRRCVSTIFLHS